jgi:hypothetical protein
LRLLVGKIDIKLLHALEGLLEVTYINLRVLNVTLQTFIICNPSSDRKALVAVGLVMEKEGQNLLIMMLALARLMTL